MNTKFQTRNKMLQSFNTLKNQQDQKSEEEEEEKRERLEILVESTK